MYLIQANGAENERHSSHSLDKQALCSNPPTSGHTHTHTHTHTHAHTYKPLQPFAPTLR